MKPTALIAAILIVIGVIALAYGGFSLTTKEKVAEVGPLKLEKDKTHSVSLPPILGVAALVGGVALLVASRRA
jgi:drug/metabolite transporter (DMT)-like permease